MEAQPAFIAKPALVDANVASADRSINLSVRSGVAGNSAASRPRRMINAEVAAGAARANRRGSLQEPHTDLESEIGVGQGPDRLCTTIRTKRPRMRNQPSPLANL